MGQVGQKGQPGQPGRKTVGTAGTRKKAAGTARTVGKKGTVGTEESKGKAQTKGQEERMDSTGPTPQEEKEKRSQEHTKQKRVNTGSLLGRETTYDKADNPAGNQALTRQRRARAAPVPRLPHTQLPPPRGRGPAPGEHRAGAHARACVGLGAGKVDSATPAGKSRYLAPTRPQQPAKAVGVRPIRGRKQRRKSEESEVFITPPALGAFWAFFPHCRPSPPCPVL